MKLLVAGDIHMGRSSTRVPDASSDDISSRAAWGRIVKLAVDRKVDAVCLTGDVADGNNRYFAAITPLRDGLQQLGSDGINTYAVSGNHDHIVMAELARDTGSALTLLGQGGQWESVRVEGRDRSVELIGWSYPSEHVVDSPLGQLPQPAAGDGDMPRVVLLHCDLGQAASRYIPMSIEQLRARDDIGLWLFGHLHGHQMHSLNGDNKAVYPGSPQALDFGEQGRHGCVLAELTAAGWELEFIPLSTVEYIVFEIDLADGQEDPSADWKDKVGAKVDEKVNALKEGNKGLQHVAARIKLTGLTQHASDVRRRYGELDQLGGLRSQANLQLHIDAIDPQVLPPMRLQEQANKTDAIGRLAGIALRHDIDDDLREDVRRVMGLARDNTYFRVLFGHQNGADHMDLTDDRVDDMIRQQAMRILTALHQKGRLE